MAAASTEGTAGAAGAERAPGVEGRVRLDPVHAGQLGSYEAANAARVFEQFLEMRLAHDGFWEWLMCYPPHYGVASPDPAVEDEIDRAILALLGFQHGTRTWGQTAAELREGRSRLSGLARH